MADVMSGLGTVAQQGLTFAVFIIVAVFVGILVFGMVYFLKMEGRYKQYKIRILCTDSFGKSYWENDTGGVFVEKKTNLKALYLKKDKAALNPDNIPVHLENKAKIIYLRKYGVKSYRYIKDIQIENDKIIATVGEEDVNTAIASYERAKKLFINSQLMQMMPFIVIAVVSVIILILFISLFKKFDVLADIAAKLDHAATVLAQASSGTTVITP